VLEVSSNFHPYECDGDGFCLHCDRTIQPGHHPSTCALCDPEYDGRPNEHWLASNLGSLENAAGRVAPAPESR
jgi:hypothetical protein